MEQEKAECDQLRDLLWQFIEKIDPDAQGDVIKCAKRALEKLEGTTG